MAGRAKAFRGWRMFSKCPRRRLSQFTLSSTRYEGARFPFRQRDEGPHRGRAHARPPDFTGSAVALARAGGARGALVGDAASDLRPPFPRQFLLIFHKAAAGELQEESGLMALAKLSEIDVALEGVRGAKDFFEAKVRWLPPVPDGCPLPPPCATGAAGQWPSHRLPRDEGQVDRVCPHAS